MPSSLTTDAKVLTIKHEAVREVRQNVMPYLTTAEQWRYDKVAWCFAIMLGEVPENTPEPKEPNPLDTSTLTG